MTADTLTKDESIRLMQAEIERLRELFTLQTDQDATHNKAHITKWEKERELLSAEIERLRDALRAVVAKDARAMYERCPDCDYDSCYENKRCKNVPLSQIGIIAREALGE